MNIRGIVLAGGKGTRLGELTKVTNKHLLPVGDVPMVYHPLKKIIGGGIRDILLVSGTEHMGDFVELLGSGKDHGCALTYRVQDEAGGIAQAVPRVRHEVVGRVHVAGVPGHRLAAVEFAYTDGTSGTLTLTCDQLLKAIGQTFLPDDLGAEVVELAGGRLAVDADRRTSLAGVWAGGDCVAGGKDLTVAAVEDGKQAALSIDRTLRAATVTRAA